jgi:DMSO/TMAO reductase YedYZ molybdopterin-dependent catalytic subunit
LINIVEALRSRATAAVVALGFGLGVSAQTPQATTTLIVSGNVAQRLTLTIDDLKRYSAHQVAYTPRGGMSPASSTEPARQYTGCLLRDILSAAKPTESAPRDLRKSYVLATASDGYEVVFSWAELFVSPTGDSVFIVYERDGAPLADDEGRIALIVTSDLRPARHVKWLQALTLRTAGKMN